MKLLLILLMGFLKMIPALTQDFDPAGIKVRLENTTNDTSMRMVLFDSRILCLFRDQFDSSLFYAERSIALAKKIKFSIK
jgi:hypothetical protein